MRWRKFIVRLRTAFNILFNRYDHWTLLVMRTKDLENLLLETDFNVRQVDYQLQPYNSACLIKGVASLYDDDTMILMKAEWEADAVESGIDMEGFDKLREELR